MAPTYEEECEIAQKAQSREGSLLCFTSKIILNNLH